MSISSNVFYLQNHLSIQKVVHRADMEHERKNERTPEGTFELQTVEEGYTKVWMGKHEGKSIVVM